MVPSSREIIKRSFHGRNIMAGIMRGKTYKAPVSNFVKPLYFHKPNRIGRCRNPNMPLKIAAMLLM